MAPVLATLISGGNRSEVVVDAGQSLKNVPRFRELATSAENEAAHVFDVSGNEEGGVLIDLDSRELQLRPGEAPLHVPEGTVFYGITRSGSDGIAIHVADGNAIGYIILEPISSEAAAELKASHGTVNFGKER